MGKVRFYRGFAGAEPPRQEYDDGLAQEREAELSRLEFQQMQVRHERRERRAQARKPRKQDLANKREDAAKKLAEERGYVVLRRGWPDFLLWDEENKKAVFLEVKAKALGGKKPVVGTHTLTGDQERMHEILKAIGLDVQIIYIE